MAFTNYTYALSDFPNDVADTARLHGEIDSAQITIKVNGLSESSGNIVITFQAPLSAGEITVLDGLVAAHSGLPLPNDEIIRVATEKPSLDEVWFHTPNWCDPTTWYQRSVRIVDEVLVEVGITRLQFKATHGHIVDITHGKIPMEDSIPFDTDHLVHVYIDGVEKTQNIPLLFRGGDRDYEVDYNAGVVTFSQPVPQGAVVTMTYCSSRNSTFTMTPKDGTRVLLQSAEIEFTTDFDMRDTIRYQAFAYASFVAGKAGITVAQLEAGLIAQYGSRDELFEFLGLVSMMGMPMQRSLMGSDKVPIPNSGRVYKTYWDFKAQSNGNYAPAPAVGGHLRGVRSPSFTHEFDYKGAKGLDSRVGLEARVWLENHEPFGNVGTSKATATFYGLVEVL